MAVPSENLAAQAVERAMSTAILSWRAAIFSASLALAFCPPSSVLSMTMTRNEHLLQAYKNLGVKGRMQEVLRHATWCDPRVITRAARHGFGVRGR